jgi:hypothetical protein
MEVRKVTKTSTNWVLSRIVALDEVRPGLAGQYLRASDERRHVIAAYFASGTATSFSTRFEANLLASGNHDDILSAAYGSVPNGFRAALSRAGHRAQPGRFYIYLRALLASRQARDVLAVLAQQPTLDLTRLRVMRTLPISIRTPRMVAMHRDTTAARQTTNLFRLMVENGVDAMALAQAIRQVQTPGELARCWRRWVEKLNFPEPPIPARSDYRPILTGRDLKATALIFRNCMRRFLSDALDGRDAFAVFCAPEQEIVVHLRRRDGLWSLEGCHARGNRPVLIGARKAATDFARAHGIMEFERKRSSVGKWEPLREMIARWEFDHEMETGWG